MWKEGLRLPHDQVIYTTRNRLFKWGVQAGSRGRCKSSRTSVLLVSWCWIPPQPLIWRKFSMVMKRPIKGEISLNTLSTKIRMEENYKTILPRQPVCPLRHHYHTSQVTYLQQLRISTSLSLSISPFRRNRKSLRKRWLQSMLRAGSTSPSSPEKRRPIHLHHLWRLRTTSRRTDIK
jgi:hypothetical protein